MSHDSRKCEDCKKRNEEAGKELRKLDKSVRIKLSKAAIEARRLLPNACISERACSVYITNKDKITGEPAVGFYYCDEHKAIN